MLIVFLVFLIFLIFLAGVWGILKKGEHKSPPNLFYAENCILSSGQHNQSEILRRDILPTAICCILRKRYIVIPSCFEGKPSWQPIFWGYNLNSVNPWKLISIELSFLRNYPRGRIKLQWIKDIHLKKTVNLYTIRFKRVWKKMLVCILHSKTFLVGKLAVPSISWEEIVEFLRFEFYYLFANSTITWSKVC